MGRILKKRLNAQEDPENITIGKAQKKKFKISEQQKVISEKNKSSILGKNGCNTVKRMALVDKTNKTSPIRGSQKVKDPFQSNTDSLYQKPASPINAENEKSYTATFHDNEQKSPSLVSRENDIVADKCSEIVVSRYKLPPIERPVTRSRKVIVSNSKEKPPKNGTKRNGETTRSAIVPKKKYKESSVNNKIELPHTPKPPNIPQSKTIDDDSIDENRSPNILPIQTRRRSAFIEKSLENVPPQSPGKSPELSPALKTGTRAKHIKVGSTILNKLKETPVRKRVCSPRTSIELKVADEGGDAAVSDIVPTNTVAPVANKVIQMCTECDKIKNFCTCIKISEMPVSSIKPNDVSTIKDSSLKIVKINDTPSSEPTPSCSKFPAIDFTFRKPRTPKRTSHNIEKGSPNLKYNPQSPMFSIFRKPDTPRRNSSENKIFTSGSNENQNDCSGRNLRPVYNTPMTPLKRRSSLPREQKEGLYEFEVDEDEPKPKKKHRPIMKIQRVRAVKRKKPKVYVADPETEMRVLRNLDLSPTVWHDMMGHKKKKIEEGVSTSAQPSTSTQAAESKEAPGTNLLVPNKSSGEKKDPSPDGPVVDDVDVEDDYHEDADFAGDPCPSSPCSKYGASTPLQNGTDKLRESFLDVSIGNFGGLSNKCYSPVKSKDSPIPVLMANYNNDPKRASNDYVRSMSNVSYNSGYQNDLDISASTPVKRRLHDSTTLIGEHNRAPQPVDLNISNCFGFDEPEVMEEPLVSPIKNTIYVTRQIAPQQNVSPARARLVRRKLPVVQPPVQAAAIDVPQVIKQLRFEVGENSSTSSLNNLSVFDDTEVSPTKRSPIKRYMKTKDNYADEGEHDESLEVAHTSKFQAPRFSYEQRRLRKRVVIDQTHVDATHSIDSDDELNHSQDEDEEHIEVEFEPKKQAKEKPKKKVAPKKKDKCMTKKEEEELEKWAKMFNSQCDQVDGYGLCIEKIMRTR